MVPEVSGLDNLPVALRLPLDRLAVHESGPLASLLLLMQVLFLFALADAAGAPGPGLSASAEPVAEDMDLGHVQTEHEEKRGRPKGSRTIPKEGRRQLENQKLRLPTE